MKFTGVAIAESLMSDSVLNFVEVKSRETADLTDPTADQPKSVTVLTFEVGDDMASAVADELSRNLKAGHWYADMGTEYEKIVVFPSKIFRYATKEVDKHQKAVAYAKSLHIPESQIAF